MARHWRAALAGAAALLLSACASTDTTPGLRPFTTDGCSMFPNRSPLGKADWCQCCVIHDLAYWRGGTAAERLQADKELNLCIQREANQAVAALMFAGVRVGGMPYFPTTFRWGYGWPVGRPYGPLTADEAASAAAAEEKYRRDHPTLPCPSCPQAAPH